VPGESKRRASRAVDGAQRPAGTYAYAEPPKTRIPSRRHAAQRPGDEMSPPPTRPTGDSASRLAQACESLGIELAACRRQLLLQYLDQLQRWNRTYNLTALRDPGQMLVQHVFDSLAALPPIAEALAGTNDACVMDVGSGAGLPGVVLAVARPDWRVCCVDAVEKKTAFVNQMAGVLRLPNLSARHARVEALAPAQCDLVVSRAFASLADFAALAGHHVRAGGTLLAMKGRRPEEEILALQEREPWQVQRVQALDVPELQAQRCLIWMRREGST